MTFDRAFALTRRSFLAGSGASMVFGGLGSRVQAMQSFTAGEYEVTTLSDGHLALPPTMFASDADPAALSDALAAAGQAGPVVKSPLNVTLLQSGEEKILVDAGSGPRFMDTAGELEAALGDLGVEPDAITRVIFTHAHPDHLWGIINDFDELSYPNATYSISEDEWNFWMAEDVLTRLPESRQGFAVGARRHLEVASEQVSTFRPGAEIVSGVRAIDTAGHTPGHVSLEVGAGSDVAVVLGDALMHPVISFQHPEWQPEMDQEPDKAVSTRMRLLDRLATDGHRIIGYHLPTPGIGRVVRRNGRFAFAPLA